MVRFLVILLLLLVEGVQLWLKGAVADGSFYRVLASKVKFFIGHATIITVKFEQPTEIYCFSFRYYKFTI